MWSWVSEINAPKPEESWAQIRSMRARPPGQASSGMRKVTFGAALEQSEQFWNAASSVGVQTRPVLAFYCLSQAGRAVAAAAHSLAAAESTLYGHGIYSPTLRSGSKRQLANIRLTSNRGSFATVSTLLGAGPISGVRLIEFWNALPELQSFPLPGTGGRQPLVVEMFPLGGGMDGWADAEVGPIPSSLGHTVPPDAELSRKQECGLAMERKRVRAHLSKYSGLEDVEFQASTGPLGLQYKTDGSVYVPVRWRTDGTPNSAPAVIGAHCTSYRGSQFFFPLIGKFNIKTHPIQLWWCLLYSLSMLARYEPAAWDRWTDVGRSSLAVPIEHALRQALAALPTVIHDALVEVSS